MARSVFPRLSPRGFMERAIASRLMVMHELALERHLNRVIETAGRSAARHYRAHGREAATDAIKAVAPAVGRVLKPAIRATAREFGQRVISQAKSAIAPALTHKAGYGPFNGTLQAKAFEDLDAEIEAFIQRHSAERVVQISDALRARINQIIQNGMDQELGVDLIADAIVEATSGEMSAFRARRIARTETHTAANAGQLAAARNSPIKFRKRWLSTEDRRTRPAHAEANDQVVDLDEPFLIGGEEMMMPGDPKASPGNVINCRCTVLYEPVPVTDLTPAERVEQEQDAGDIDPPDLLQDRELWVAFFRQLQDARTLPADVVLYATGPDCGLPRFATAEDLMSEIGSELTPPMSASLSPVLINGGAGIQDSFPLYGRPVVVKITVPAGTPAAVGTMVAMELHLQTRFTRQNPPRIVVRSVTEERWGEVQEEAEVPLDANPPRRAYRRLPPKRGVTIVEAEVVE